MNLNAYSPQIIVGTCVIVLLVMLFVLWGVVRQRNRMRTQDLRAQFGPEYDWALREYGSRRKAEAALHARVQRVKGFRLRPLSASERNEYLNEWDSLQARFVDHPRGAVTEADEMIHSVLHALGYAGTAFEQRTEDLSVHHARVVEPYRRANAITARAGKNEATTEELRTAMILYRALLEEMLEAKTEAMSHVAA